MELAGTSRLSPIDTRSKVISRKLIQCLMSSGYLLCIAGGSVYLEYTAYFPSRSGAEVVFLEQAYPHPTWFFPTTFAIQSVILSFSSSNAVGKHLSHAYVHTQSRCLCSRVEKANTTNTIPVLANYLFKCAGTAGTNWQIKGAAIAGYTVVILGKQTWHPAHPLLHTTRAGVVYVLTVHL